MSAFNKDKLMLTSQGITGGRSWFYTDTGLLVAEINETAGYFTTGYEMGMRRGDLLLVQEGDTGSGAKTIGGHRNYGYVVTKAVSDTGETQVSVGLGVLIGDTS